MQLITKKYEFIQSSKMSGVYYMLGSIENKNKVLVLKEAINYIKQVNKLQYNVIKSRIQE